MSLRFKQAIESINKDEFIEFYKNNSSTITAEKYNISCDYVLPKLLEKYGIEPHSHKENIELTCISRYGARHSHTEESEKKYKASLLSRYGTHENYVKHMLESMKNTCKEKYGVDYSAQSEEVKNKHIETNMLKHGESCYFKTKEFKDKAANTCLNRYGEEYYSRTEQWRKQVYNTHIKRFGDYEAYRKHVVEKVQNTCLEKYGVVSASMLPEYKEKEYQTKKRNNTFRSSSSEEYAYNKLVYKYGKENVLREYMEERYPFKCDFYIVPHDVFIELNIHWTHGGLHFNPEDINCQKQLKLWKEKSLYSRFYAEALETWTVRDVNKQKYVKKNNLNYIDFYSIKEFDEWLNH